MRKRFLNISYILTFLISSITSISYVFAVDKVSCGNITDIPAKIPELTNMAINILQIAAPAILVVMGMIDFFKAMSSGKEDEIKKNQNIFIKRLIIAVLIFFIVVIVKFAISLIANALDTKNITSCINCFINNKCN